MIANSTQTGVWSIRKCLINRVAAVTYPYRYRFRVFPLRSDYQILYSNPPSPKEIRNEESYKKPSVKEERRRKDEDRGLDILTEIYYTNPPSPKETRSKESYKKPSVKEERRRKEKIGVDKKSCNY